MAAMQQVCSGSAASAWGRASSCKSTPFHVARDARRDSRVRALDPSSISDGLSSVVAHLPLLYEPVALPCSMMKCGDVLHRSTLDPVLRGEVTGPDWRTYLLLATAAGYLFLPPGVLPGAIDYYILAKLRVLQNPAYGKEDVILGPKLASGGFGTVYKGELKTTDGKTLPVIVKKATEFGQAEAWFNERMNRIPGRHAAEFITAFDEVDLDDPAQAKKVKKGLSKQGTVWLVWKFEGPNTLFNMMESRDFPYNMEVPLLGRQLRLPKGVQRQAVTVKVAFKQLLEALQAMHVTGIVHRDIKPQNCILSEDDKKIKLIDLGAAADLRVGINYAPQEYLLDPRYAPPQQYIMSTQTPTPPPPPVAAFLSPVLWNMENPDRFDMWSCGVTLLQMVFPSLRNDNNLIAFNKRLEALGYDLRKWRLEEESKKGGMKQDMVDGFAILDLDGGAGWELVNQLMAFKPKDRCTASEALASRFFADPSPAVAAAGSALSSVTKTLSKTFDNEVFSTFAQQATGEDRGALTEAQLRQELGLDEKLEAAPKRASNTIVWWKERQNLLRKNIEQRKEGSGGSSGLPMKGAKASSPGKNGSRSPSPTSSVLSSSDSGDAAAKPGLGGLFGGLANGLKVSPGRNGNGNGNGNGAEKRARAAAVSASDESSDDEAEVPAVPGQKGSGLSFFNNLLRK